jgi:hypothetical protein
MDKTLKIVGWIMIGLGFILGLVLGGGENSTLLWSITIVWWSSGTVSGLLFLALGKIITLQYDLLRQINDLPSKDITYDFQSRTIPNNLDVTNNISSKDFKMTPIE